MQSFEISSHISGQFNQELEALKNAVLTMGGLVEQQLSATLKAMRDSDPRAAEKIVLDDAKVNEMESQIDEECMRIIARRHPIASDLRLVLTVVKITADVERIGDEVERIARMIVLDNVPMSQTFKAGMYNTGHMTLDMLRETLDALARMDSEKASAIHVDDKKIDEQYKMLLLQALQEMQGEPEILPEWLDVVWALRAMERIGDRCQNICEYVIYNDRGVDVRHKDASFFESESNLK